MMRFVKPLFLLLVAASLAGTAAAQNCQTAKEMDATTTAAIENTARRMFSYVPAGDFASMKSASIPAVAGQFGAIESGMSEARANLQGSQGRIRSVFLLEAPGDEPLAIANFYCGVVNSPDWTQFNIPNLPPGKYALAIVDAEGGKVPYTISFILQEGGGQWRLAGFYPKPAQIVGLDGNWFWTQARNFKNSGKPYAAWFYYQIARFLIMPVDFIMNPELERFAQEMEQARPKDVPVDQPVTLALGGKQYSVTTMAPEPVGEEIALVVRYQTQSIADTAATFKSNADFIKQLVTRYPEYREAFGTVVARAVAPSGQDYGTMLLLKDVK